MVTDLRYGIGGGVSGAAGRGAGLVWWGMKVRLLVVAGVLACRPGGTQGTVGPGEGAMAAPDPRDVTRAGVEPPMYRASSSGPLVAITRNAYGKYSDAPRAPQLSDTIADFELPNARGGTWSLKEARAKGPVVIVFYRGFW